MEHETLTKLCLLCVAKSITDGDKRLFKLRKESTWDDNFDLLYEIYPFIFDDFNDIYNEELGLVNWVITDAAMEQFYDLCRLYEGRMGISEAENPYRKNLLEETYGFGEVHMAGYFGFELRTNINLSRRCAIIIQHWDDGGFWVDEDFVYMMVHLRLSFKSGCMRLREEISSFDNRLFYCALPEGRQHG